MDNNALVSIIIAVYNAQDCIQVAINSVLRQTYPNWELILLDDASTDNTVEVVRSFADSRISLIANKENLGAYARTNQGIALSKGSYIAILDQDDLMFPFRILEQKLYLDKHQEVDVVGGYMVTFNDSYEVIGVVEQQLPSSYAELVVKGKCFLHPTVMGRRNWYLKNGYDPLFRRTGDYEMWVRTYRESVFALIEKPLIYYRTSGGIQPQWKYEVVWRDGQKLFKKHAANISFFLRFKALSILYLKFRLYPLLAAFGLLTRSRPILGKENEIYQAGLNEMTSTATTSN